MTNWNLIDETLANIRRSPGGFEMSDWARRTSCGTRMCFAGWAVVTAGEELRWNTAPSEDEFASAEYTTTGYTIEDRARTLLGITEDAADTIFYADITNSVEALEGLILNVLGDRPE